ncbi:MAG: aldo/keto reductase [Clostridium sp.]|nr:aldo/keto reductase [Acetatifactor muris]MCM1526884.1 aldo/keto reductase [Bacteroides sp.]MCM1563323.1 aldo/keto reductase [Clostridium sp.]
MEYRVNRRTGDRISALGFGTSYIAEAGERDAVATIQRAYEGGVNYYDLATADSRTFSCFGTALGAVRKNVLYQVHFGANYETGTYGWSTDGETIRRGIEWQLAQLRTDYIDYGFIHCIDEISDWRDYRQNGALAYLLQMKEQGVVKHIGLSSHTPSTIRKVLDDIGVDMLMFSANPGYDYQRGDYAKGSVDERSAIYRRCEAEGIGISVMKPFSGGQLLDAAVSPFGKALTAYQCIRYALDRPGVLTVLPGMSSVAQVERLLAYFEAPEEEKDYSVIGSFSPAEAVGKCVYCNHCKPCPMGLDIGIINKYYDLAQNGDSMAAEHYRNLEVKADACAQCGHCESRCPFHVKQESRMKEIAAYFQ